MKLIDIEKVKEAYCSYEVSELLKKKGFDEPCNHYYFYRNLREVSFYEKNSKACYYEEAEHCTAPTHQTALAWLRARGLHIQPYPTSLGWYFEVFSLTDLDVTGAKPIYQVGIPTKENCHPSYEDATEEAIKHVLINLL